MKQQYLLLINRAPTGFIDLFEDVKQQHTVFKGLTLLILTPNPDDYSETKDSVRVVHCNFDTSQEIEAALEPYRLAIAGVICRGDKYIQDLRRVIPFLPPSVLVATPEALAASTDKKLMRAAFMQRSPEITPQFIEVNDPSDATLAAIEAHVQYPVIVKPASLASSLLIQSCKDQSELREALEKVFDRIEGIYRREGRRDAPRVIVEEYLEGDFYSIDAYVMKANDVYFCPPVAYIPAKQLNIDDFFLYKRFVPTTLTAEDVAAANQTAAKAIAAVGLTHSTAHVELVRTIHGWKVIELGPRVGRFRVAMYREGYGIDHSLNDMLIHVGQKPVLDDGFKGYCAAYSIYPDHEGTLQSIKGIEFIEKNPLVVYFNLAAQPGEQCKFAKHGGHALAEFIIASKDKDAFDELVAFVEDQVAAVIR